MEKENQSIKKTKRSTKVFRTLYIVFGTFALIFFAMLIRAGISRYYQDGRVEFRLDESLVLAIPLLLSLIFGYMCFRTYHPRKHQKVKRIVLTQDFIDSLSDAEKVDLVQKALKPTEKRARLYFTLAVVTLCISGFGLLLPFARLAAYYDYGVRSLKEQPANRAKDTFLSWAGLFYNGASNFILKLFKRKPFAGYVLYSIEKIDTNVNMEQTLVQGQE